VDCVRHGQSNPAIAKRLSISVDGVKFHVSNALSKLNLRSRKELQVWNGIALDSAYGRQERKTMNTETLRPGVGPLGQIGRSCRSIAEAEAWYRDVLGLPHLFTFGDLAFFDCGGVRLMLSAGETNPPADSILYFRVHDIAATCKALQSRGAKLQSALHKIHTHEDGAEEWMAFINDNEGRPLGLMSVVAPH
jgi:catechol 2,3-dioxygenase-like lactoylglutathione lyase family enzyme